MTGLAERGQRIQLIAVPSAEGRIPTVMNLEGIRRVAAATPVPIPCEGGRTEGLPCRAAQIGVISVAAHRSLPPDLASDVADAGRTIEWTVVGSGFHVGLPSPSVVEDTETHAVELDFTVVVVPGLQDVD